MLIWGTGCLTAEVIGKYINSDKIEGFIDNNPNIHEFMVGGVNKPVYRPADINELEYDAIVVVSSYSEDIYHQCLDLGIDMHKLIFVYGNCVAKDLNKDYQFVSNIVGAEFADMIREQYRMVKMVNASGDLFLHDNPDLLSEHAYRTDAIRIQNFNLIVKEIRKKKVRGSVAEVGVFRGEFAQYINRAFSDRTLYLFDTFEGFSDDEAKDELESGNCTELFVEVFKDTSLEEVLKRMKYKDKIVIKKGLFPESLDGLEDTFAFVSIDVDFEQSIYDCIDYFYPRMNEGGYIYIHDYNSPLKGVENAVTNYEEAHKMILHKVPICDSCGTLVIVK